MFSKLRFLLLTLALAFPAGLAAAGAPLALGAVAKRQKVTGSAKHARALRARAFGPRAVGVAFGLLGVPYRYGGSSPGTGFDCSGFVSYVYRRLGVTLPRTSYGQFGIGLRVPRGALRPGDLVFFDHAGHVGIYVGRNRFVHSPNSGERVRVSRLSDAWYGARYSGARRLPLAARR